MNLLITLIVGYFLLRIGWWLFQLLFIGFPMVRKEIGSSRFVEVRTKSIFSFLREQYDAWWAEEDRKALLARQRGE